MDVVAYALDDQTFVRCDTSGIQTHSLDPAIILWQMMGDASLPVTQWVYHLDYFVARLLHFLNVSEKQGAHLWDTGDLYLPGQGWKLGYRQGKYLSVQFGGRRPFALICDARQYMPCPLPRTAMEAAREAYQTGVDVMVAFEAIDLPTTAPISPISVYQKRIMQHMDLPTIDHYPEPVGELAYEACCGGWLEAYRAGHWKQAWDYDLNSAYPAVAATLYDTRRGIWRHSQIIPDDAVYGVARCKASMDADLHPVFLRGDDFHTTPIGQWWTVTTLDAIRFVRLHHLGSLEIDDGWWWVPSPARPTEQPWRVETERLYAQKLAATGITQAIVKRILTGIYGKMLETHNNGNSMGPLFNPVWAAEIETRTRLMVAQVALQNEVTPIHIAVDGLLTDRPLPLESNTTLGAWKLSHVGATLCLGTGLVAIEGKHGHGDFALDYSSLYQQMHDNPQATELYMEKCSPVTLAGALHMHRWIALGNLERVHRTIHLAGDRKRCWPDDPSTASDLLTRQFVSVPWDASLFHTRREVWMSKLHPDSYGATNTSSGNGLMTA